MIYYIEDLVHDVVYNNAQLLPKTDFLLFMSISKQLKRNLALTEKQHALLCRKINENYSAFSSQYEGLDAVLDKVKVPYRHVDKTKLVSFAKRPGVLEDKDYYITITFPYSKPCMNALEDIKKQTNTAFSPKYNKTHYITYSEKNLVIVVNKLSKMNFTIDDTVQVVYNKIMEFDKQTCCPRIENESFHNMEPVLQDHLIERFGNITPKSLLLYYDRATLYGYSMNSREVNQSLHFYSAAASRIAKRKSRCVHLLPTKYDIEELFRALTELKRFPAIIFMDKRYTNSSLPLYLKALSTMMDMQNVAVYLPQCVGVTSFDQAFKSAKSELLSTYKVSTQRNEHTKVAFVTSVTYTHKSLTDWTPESVILTETTQVMEMSTKFLKSYKTHDLVVNYSNTTPSQLVSICNRIFGGIAVDEQTTE